MLVLEDADDARDFAEEEGRESCFGEDTDPFSECVRTIFPDEDLLLVGDIFLTDDGRPAEDSPVPLSGFIISDSLKSTELLVCLSAISISFLARIYRLCSRKRERS